MKSLPTSTELLKAINQRNATLGMPETTLTVKDIDKRQKTYKDDKETADDANEVARKSREAFSNLLVYGGFDPLKDDGLTLTLAELITKVEEIMPTKFPSGGNAKQISAAVGYGCEADNISALYWQDGQSLLKKEKDDKTGKVYIGLKTRYLLATKDDLEEINKDKATEKAARVAQKAKTSSTK